MNNKIVEKFTDSKDFEKLNGGQNESFKVGNLAIKPIYEKDKYIWVAETLEKIETDCLFISKPVRSRQGNWIEGGFGASQYLEGEFFKYRMDEKLEISKKLNGIFEKITLPDNFNSWNSPWIEASKCSWCDGKLPKNTFPKAREKIEYLKSQIKPLNNEGQIIHSDLAGNILFNKNNSPVIIDFSPDFKPAKYSNVLLVVDSIAWHDEDISSINKLKNDDDSEQLILRAIIFRLCVPLFFDPQDQDSFFETYKEFESVIDHEKLT